MENNGDNNSNGQLSSKTSTMENNGDNNSSTPATATLISEATRSTLARIESRRRPGGRIGKRKRCVFLDNTQPGYGWLLPGWVVEERYMESGRIYKYYYDPAGCMYSSLTDVMHVWEQSGLVVLDQ
ncbi:hypothetical protein ACOSP7_032570 [Xanthoceras sorbifolium]|uniref:MBD domain-containing protein n=1 Tax=Xanthoceras sorbifolium TaxID=99658 RepID=A0ABQ8H477_9ROSI|nr:hypothetical protein JRO89_XS14G0067400 [Xanthoceras sorbifolium]